MFQRFSRGWGIVSTSWAVLRQHPSLLILPVFSGVAFAALLAAIGFSVFAGYNAGALTDAAGEVRGDNPLLYVAAFGFYFVSMFIVIFFNAALVACALDALAGREPSISRGISAAMNRLPQIFGWTLVASTVGLLLNILQSFLRDKLGFIGALLGGGAELAWSVTTYFVVPVVVAEGVGPIEGVKRSGAILKKTWGESLGGEGGMGLISFLFSLPLVLLVVVGVSLSRDTDIGPTVIAALITIAVFYMLALTVVFSALATIFRAGAYVYATTGQPPGGMNRSFLESTFR